MTRGALSVRVSSVVIMTAAPHRNRLIVVDTETTGLDCVRHQPWEVSWCDITTAVTDAVPLSALPVHTLLLPHSTEGADPVALEIGRYDSRCVGRVASAAEVRDLWGVLGGDVDEPKRRPVVIGSNPGFDLAMLGGLFDRHGLSSGPSYQRPTDVSEIARWGLGWVSENSHLPLGLGLLCDRLGVHNADAHTAASDVRATSEVYLRLTAMVATAHAETTAQVSAAGV